MLEKINFFRRYGFDEKRYKACQSVIDKENHHVLLSISGFFLVLCSFALINALVGEADRRYKIVYLAFIVTSFFVCLLTYLMGRKSSRLTMGLWYFYFVAVLLFGTILGIFIAPNISSVTFMVSIVGLSMIFIGNASAISMILFVMCAVFCISALKMKIQLLQQVDITNCIVFGSMGIFLHYKVGQVRITNMLKDKQQKEINEKLRGVNNTMQGAFLQLENDEKWTLLEANPCFYHYIGYTKEQFELELKNEVFSLLREDYIAPVKKIMAENLAKSNLTSNEACFIRRDGSYFYAWVAAELVTEKEGKSYFYCTFMDISQQKESQDRLMQSEQRFRYALEETDISVWEYDFQKHTIIQIAKCRRCSEKADHLENVPEILFETNYYHPDSQQKAREVFEKMHCGEKFVTADLLVWDEKIQEYWWQRVRYHTIFDNGGNSIKAIAIGKDVTEEKNAQKRYEEEIAYLQELNDPKLICAGKANLTKSIIVNYVQKGEKEDESGILTYADILDRATSFIIEEKEKKEFYQIFSRENLQKVLAQGKNRMTYEYRRILKSGETAWVVTSIKMMKSPVDQDIMMVGYTRDITDEKISRDITHYMFNKMYEFVLYIDGNTKEFISYPNGFSEPIKGKDYGTYLKSVLQRETQHFTAFEVEEAYEKMTLERVKKELSDKDKYTFGVYSVDVNGRTMYKKYHYSYLNREQSSMILVRTDITSMYEQELEQKQRLKEAIVSAQQGNRAKTIFLSSMSHDIRTPMNAIVGMAELAQLEIEDKEKVQEALQVINSSAKQLLELINDILDMSKIESGAMIYANNNFILSEEIEKTSESLQSLFQEKNQKYCLEIKDIIHNKLRGDVMRLNCVFINLLNNASKFTQEGGNVRFTVEEYPSENKKYANFRFTIADNGIGIPKEKQGEIFKPFYREGVSSINQIEGTGLGLSIVKSIVEAHGGMIRVISEAGKGTTFILEMPIIVARESAVLATIEKKEKEEKIDFTGMKILLVEDHPVNTLVATKLLEKNGAVVDTAENGSAGYDKLVSQAENTYDLIFMDIQMPVMNGYEAARAIRQSEHPQGKTIPIIAMTANVFAEDIQKSLEAGMNAHIGKPISLKEMAKVIVKWKKGDDNCEKDARH